jgi:hypothetical protein
MRNASHHPFLLASKLSRNAYRYWKNVSRQPVVRRVQSTLIWLPTLTIFTQIGSTIRAVTGNSMQVRTHTIHKAAPHDTPFALGGPLLRSICQLSQR